MSVPPLVGNKPVTRICEKTFLDCIGIESITIPESVTGIGKRAFSDCQSLRTVVLPEGIEKKSVIHILVDRKNVKLVTASGAAVEAHVILSGVTVVVTSDLSCERDEFGELVAYYGGRMTGSVSGKTTCLVANDLDSSTSKLDKARQLGIPVLSEKEFYEKYFPDGRP